MRIATRRTKCFRFGQHARIEIAVTFPGICFEKAEGYKQLSVDFPTDFLYRKVGSVILCGFQVLGFGITVEVAHYLKEEKR